MFFCFIGQSIISAAAVPQHQQGNPTAQQLQQQQIYYQQMGGYWYPTAATASYPQMTAQYMAQQGSYAGYPFAYTTAAAASPQNPAAAYTRLIPPTNMWGVPPNAAIQNQISNSISNGGGSSTNNSNGTPQPMLYTMQQFQTQ